jgi:hypothetical protein
MKILHINNFNYPDYLNDMIYHGGFSIFGPDYETSHDPSYMFSDHEKRRPEIHLLHCHGKGFNIYKKLDPQNITINNHESIKDKILHKYFDYIIFGSIWRCNDYYDLVKKNYSSDKILLIDGEDHVGIHYNFAAHGVYFKRELVSKDNKIFPISFSIPKNLIYDSKNEKTRLFSHIDPRDPTTYIYINDSDYNKDYRQSYFGITIKKTGWDCLRHYEIIMNGCIPIFLNLNECPDTVMTHFPKNILNTFYSANPDLNTIDATNYFSTIDSLQSHLYNKCTTEAMFKYILDTSQSFRNTYEKAQ